MSRRNRRRCRFEAGRGEADPPGQPLTMELTQAVKLVVAIARVQIKLGPPAQGSWADRACTCQTLAPRVRQLSAIAAAKRPEETLVIVRTSSMGAVVPPPVTSTFMSTATPFMSLARSRDAGLA